MGIKNRLFASSISRKCAELKVLNRKSGESAKVLSAEPEVKNTAPTIDQNDHNKMQFVTGAC